MNWEKILGFGVVALGGVWAIIQALLSRDRKSIDDRADNIERGYKCEVARLDKSYKEARHKMWEKIDSHAHDINDLKLLLTEVKGRINALPDAAAINATLAQFELKVEKRLDSLSKQLQELVAAVISFKAGGA